MLFEIRCKIECLNFNAKDEDEAEKLFMKSISDKYGVYSAVTNFSICKSKQTTLIK